MTPTLGIPPASEAEKQVGLRCRGCDQRIVDGYEWVMISIGQGPDGALARLVRIEFSCDDTECPLHATLTEHAVARRRIRWEWLKDEEKDPSLTAERPSGLVTTERPATP